MFYRAGVHSTLYTGKTLKNVRSHNDTGQVSFRTLETIEGPEMCGNKDYYGVRVDNHPELALSILLAAYAIGKKVDVSVYDDKCDAWGRPAVKHIRIRD